MNSARDRVFAALEQHAHSEVDAADVQQLRARLQRADEQAQTVERTEEDRVARFRERAETAGAVVMRADTPADVAVLLETYLQSAAAIIVSDDDIVRSSGLEQALRGSSGGVQLRRVTDADLRRETDDWKHAYASADLGITAGIAGIAESGAVVIAASENESRSVSLLPHTHVVLLRERDIVPSLPAAATVLRRLVQDGGSSAVTLVDGPSKTADIEKVLVTGVHGPRAFVIVLIGDARDAASPGTRPQ